MGEVVYRYRQYFHIMTLYHKMSTEDRIKYKTGAMKMYYDSITDQKILALMTLFLAKKSAGKSDG